jgi:hypothetical protein
MSDDIAVMKRNLAVEVGKYRLILLEGPAKQSEEGLLFTGRTDGNKRVVFPLAKNSQLYPSMKSYRASSTPSPMLTTVTTSAAGGEHKHQDILSAHQAFQSSINTSPAVSALSPTQEVKELFGSYVVVKILKANGPTLRGVAVARSSIQDFHASTI